MQYDHSTNTHTHTHTHTHTCIYRIKEKKRGIKREEKKIHVASSCRFKHKKKKVLNIIFKTLVCRFALVVLYCYIEINIAILSVIARPFVNRLLNIYQIGVSDFFVYVSVR
jgi:hypothetical protein